MNLPNPTQEILLVLLDEEQHNHTTRVAKLQKTQ